MGLFAALAILGTATPTQALVGEATRTCHDEDQSGGWDGQSVDCAFICPAPGGTISISVRADDKDATVSGTAACADGNAHCDGPKTCSDEDEYTEAGDGTCEADSDETYDSGLYVECGANEAEVPICTPPSCDPPEWCPVQEPVRLCIEPLPTGDPGDPSPANVTYEAYHAVTGRVEEAYGDSPLPWVQREASNAIRMIVTYGLTVETDLLGWDQFVDSGGSRSWDGAVAADPLLPLKALAHDSYVFMHFDGATAVGISCQDGVCTDFTPYVHNDERGFHLSTP